MILGKVSQPKNKSELIKSLQALKSIVDIKVIENVEKKDSSSVKTDLDKFIGNRSATIVIIKEK